MTTTTPVTSAGSDEFWAEVRTGGIPLRRCAQCARTFVLPLPSCPFCSSQNPEVFSASGTGRLYSWVVVHHAFDPMFEADVPYVVAAVHLDEGARVFGRLEGVRLDDIESNMRLQRSAPSDDSGQLLVFRPQVEASS
jgi:uncharacterized OB-fold protein